MNARAAAVALSALALGGCAFASRAPLPRPIEGEWSAARDAATRRSKLYDGFTHRATVTATHLSLPVREARARRLAEWLGWTPVELADRLAVERAQAARGESFLVAFYAADPKANDLDAPISVWRVAVKVDGADLVATYTTSIDRDATVLGLFPYVGPFDVVYVVDLPRSPAGDLAGKPFVLEIASALGRLVLDFGLPNGAHAPVQTAP